MLDYDLGSEAAAANIRNQALQGIFGMLTGAQNQQQNNVSDWTGTGFETLLQQGIAKQVQDAIDRVGQNP